MYLRIASLLLAAALLAGCGPGTSRYPYRREPDPRGKEFVLGPGDELRVTVWRHAELSGTFLIPPEGTITLPLLGDVVASGRTTTAIRNEIKNRLSHFVKDETAQVTVQLTGLRSYRFSVSGEVMRGGLFSPTHYVTVTEALAMAGGFTRFAKPDRIYILRRHGGRRKIPIDYEAIIEDGRDDMNIVVLPGDIIHVP